MGRIIGFIKKETVLFVAAILAVASMFVVPPSIDYIGYIDFRTLSLLFCLMAVMAGFREIGAFGFLGKRLMGYCKTAFGLELTLVFLCFFSSMLITNDVALITFVPFAMEVLEISGKKSRVMSVVIMQTVAANLGSMLTPLGNPQNLYLYSVWGTDPISFILLMLPYTVVSFLLILITMVFFRKKGINHAPAYEKTHWDYKLIMYIVLFVLCILCVVRILPYYIVLGVILLSIIVGDKQVIKKVDYSLLLVFVSFFILVGNVGNIPAVKAYLEGLVFGNEVIVSVCASQVISNVPAALLLSGFTDNVKALIIGTNLGGLGTLIASMASLISYKYFAHTYNKEKGKYILFFTVVNLIFLSVLILFNYIMSAY